MKYIIILTLLYLCKAEKLTTTTESDNFTIVPQELEDERIFRGRNANLGQFKYQVLLEIHKNGKTSRCGGSLISTSYVLTAAHCTYGSSQVIMYFGLVDTNQRRSAVQRRSAHISIHPSYHSRTLENDISIIKTNNPVPMNRNIGTISLPMRSQSSSGHFANLAAIASGWGRTRDNEAGGHSRLQWARLHMPNQRTCKDALRRYNYNTNLNVCTDKSANRASPCKGDSGGPLAYFPIRGNPVLVGIVSWGTGGCDNPLPNVYARVGAYLNYITRNTGIRIN